jgi:hypothetical protein
MDFNSGANTADYKVTTHLNSADLADVLAHGEWGFKGTIEVIEKNRVCCQYRDDFSWHRKEMHKENE